MILKFLNSRFDNPQFPMFVFLALAMCWSQKGYKLFYIYLFSVGLKFSCSLLIQSFQTGHVLHVYNIERHDFFPWLVHSNLLEANAGTQTRRFTSILLITCIWVSCKIGKLAERQSPVLLGNSWKSCDNFYSWEICISWP